MAFSIAWSCAEVFRIKMQMRGLRHYAFEKSLPLRPENGWATCLSLIHLFHANRF